MLARKSLHRGVLFALLLAASSLCRADVSLGVLLDSSAGRFIFRESAQGSELLSRLVGSRSASEGRVIALQTLLNHPEMQEVTEQLTSRLNRIRERFARQFGRRTSQVFGATGAALRSEESALLEQLIEQELDQDFIGFLPEQPSGHLRGHAAARRSFIEGVGADIPDSAFRTLVRWARAGLEASTPVQAFEAYEAARVIHPWMETLLPRTNVYRLLADEEKTIFSDRMKLIFEQFADSDAAPTRARFLAVMRRSLRGQVPEATIAERIRGLSQGSVTSLQRALGELTLPEAQVLLHGGNPLSPSPDSLIGKYLAETGAQTVVRTFSRGGVAAVGGMGNGPRRLVVAISPNTFETYLKYFSRQNLLAHYHTPQQGTLLLAYNGAVGSYGNMGNAFQTPLLNAIMPTIVLNTSEGQRLNQFFKLAASPEAGQVALLPWTIPSENGAYCATGGYSSCTHWFGNIPIGDRLVTEYRFPGAIDGHASNRIPNSPEPRVQALSEYESENPLIHRVWKFPGNEQLGATLGIEAQNLAGELANPGWVANSLLGAASVDRVPVVFVMVGDARAPLAADFDTYINAI